MHEDARYLQLTNVILTSTIGLIADILLVVTIFKNKTIQTRSYIMLLNIAITNAIFLVDNAVDSADIPEKLGFEPVLRGGILFSIVDHVDSSYQIGCGLFVLVIVSNKADRSTLVSNKVILIAANVVIAAVVVLTFGICYTQTSSDIIYHITFLFYLMLLIMMVCKELGNCCRDDISREELVRFNIGRIFIYVWSACYFALFVGSTLQLTRYFSFVVFLHYFCLPINFNSMVILVYVSAADKEFRDCLARTVRCNKSEITDPVVYDDVKVNEGEPCQDSV